MKLAISACMAGISCNYQGVDNPFPEVQQFLQLCSEKNVTVIQFCPEESEMGTPREPMNIIGGDGFDVLKGEAQVVTHSGKNVTEAMIKGAQNMLQLCIQAGISDALMMEGSPSCASNWIFDGSKWPVRERYEGMGVTSALLNLNGISVFSLSNLKQISERVIANSD